MTPTPSPAPQVTTVQAAVIGGGPAGLMAAEMLAARGVSVAVFDAMPSVGRKFLMAGKSGLNLTHAEDAAPFLGRYGQRSVALAPMLADFGSHALRDWVHALGIETFVGSSGRVFPVGMKGAPLLRAWLHRLRDAGVTFHVRHRWTGWTEHGALRFDTPQGEHHVHASTVILALGGASWPRLGSDAAWVPLLRDRGVDIAPLQPANCGFDVDWSAHFRERHAGEPVKAVSISVTGPDGIAHARQGEFVVSERGIEGSLVYAMSAPARDAIVATGHAIVHLDLAPGLDAARVAAEVAHPRGSKSLSSHLKGRLGITGVKAGLLRECLSKAEMENPATLAAAIKALPLRLERARPIAEVISTAGGVRFEAMDAQLMLSALPGVFCAGEMLDWEAPTGGYLLTACFASGRTAGLGAADWLAARP